MAKALFWVALGIVVLLVVGSIVVSLVKALMSLAFYLIVGALAVGAGWYLYQRLRSAAARGNPR
ncbi:hypothetical protein GCM10009682_22960 [Luedemannella flava]|uniref:Uncharacterized protein n=1 Tax=Luedemannella flava TaxID=349316 RepID=A0ABP4Y916_9ACTN